MYLFNNGIARKIFNILKPSGKLILAFEDRKQMKDKPLDFEIFHIYTKNEIKEMLLLNGFSKNIIVKSKIIKSNKYHNV